ncbi:hypothetical protein FACS189428_3280 [Clostridia bacterium]|nr:hypothetical protein FACS189428_3280 [Clostridia bacterium]
MKRFNFLTLLLLLLSGAIYAQSNKKDYLNAIEKALSEKNCKWAEQMYEWYQEDTKKTNPDVERRIRECKNSPVTQPIVSSENDDSFRENNIVVLKTNGRYVVLDRSFNILAYYDEIEYPEHDDCDASWIFGTLKVIREGKMGLIDTYTGKEIIPCAYDGVYAYTDEMGCVMQNKKWGFTDKTGKVVIPCIYEEANLFSENLAAVKKNGKWGFINKTGREVTPFIYDHNIHIETLSLWGTDMEFEEDDFDAGSCPYILNNGLALVSRNGKFGFIDKTGKEIIPCIYENAKWTSEYCGSVPCCLFYLKDLVCVKYDGKWGFVSKKGQRVIPFIYDEVIGQYDEEKYVEVQKEDKTYFIDTTGKIVHPQENSFDED